MRALPSLVAAAAVAIVVLVAPATAAARVTAYAEGSTSVGNTSAGMTGVSTPTHLVKSGENVFYWYVENDSGWPTRHCSYAQVDSGAWSSTAGPPGAPSTACEANPLMDTGDSDAYLQPLTLSPGQRGTYCMAEWVDDGGGWDNTGEACHVVIADGDTPTATLSFTDATGRTGVTNNPNGLRATLTYSDSNRPRTNGGSIGDLRRCQVHDRACVPSGASSDSYDLVVGGCGIASQASATTWTHPTCAFNWAGEDATVHECFALYEGAEYDEPPSNRGLDPLATTQTFTPTGDFAHACGSIVVDTIAPTGTVSINRTNVTVGTKVTARIDAADERSGVARVAWKLDGGAIGTGTAVTRAIESPGEHTFVATVTDEAGNVHTSSITLQATAAVRKSTTNGGATTSNIFIDRNSGTVVRPVPRPQLDDHGGGGGTQVVMLPRAMLVVIAPRRLVRSKRPRYLPMTVRVRSRGVVRMTLRQGKRVRARTGVRFVRGGITGFRMRLPSWRRLPAGRYVLTVTQYRPKAKPVTKHMVIRVVNGKPRR